MPQDTTSWGRLSQGDTPFPCNHNIIAPADRFVNYYRKKHGSTLHISIGIHRSVPVIRTEDLYLKRMSTVHEIMKRRALKINKAAPRGLTGTLLYASGFMFR